MSAKEKVARQKRFYDSRTHAHLRVHDEDLYARKLATELARTVGMGSGHRVLEVGAGFGRFTFPLLDHCRAITALDLSGQLLEELEQIRDERGIPAERLGTLCCDVDALTPDALQEPFDFVVGFFFLHHLPDFARTLGTLRSLVAPGGQLAFLEPNRRNPLFLAQVMCCQDMTWREEKGMFQLSRAKVETAYHRAGLAETATRSFGFFPPPVFNRLDAARRLEERIEGLRWLEGILPFLLLSARAPGAGG